MTTASGETHDYHEQVGMCVALRRGFQNYATFRGRANWGEYWWWVLAPVLISFGLGVVDAAVFGLDGNLSLLSNLWALATLISHVAICTCRLHDIDRSGWWQLIAFISILGGILLLIWLAQKGEGRRNTFG